jgi:lipopolysaccharide transport system permease protein
LEAKKEIQDWDIVVKPKSSLFHLNLKEVWQYKDLIMLMVKRDITALYKQTILGPLWMVIQPIFTTAIYTFTFSVSAGMSTDGIPPILFYLMGQTFWVYFADSLNKTSNTFINNAGVFGKVYFPRLVMPISIIISNLVKFGLQFALMFFVYLYYAKTTNALHFQFSHLLLLPLFIILLGLFGLSIGILFSSYTTKYRDFVFLLGFAVQLMMFASCVVFPVSMYKPEVQQWFMYNPIVAFMEGIKFILTGHGSFSWWHIGIGSIVVAVTLFISIITFNKTEKSFMDTV